MLIKPVNKNTIDIFVGQGWENWSRYKKIKSGIYHVKGENLSKALLNKILLTLTENT